MNNFSNLLNTSLNENVYKTKLPWKKLISNLTFNDWSLYDQTGAPAVAKTFNKELGKLCTGAFKKVAAGTHTIEEVGLSVWSEFAKIRKSYYKFGADDTAVDEVTAEIISQIFGIDTNKFR